MYVYVHVYDDSVCAYVCARTCVQDFVTSLSVIARGSHDEKLRWTFQLYDADGDGVITRSEMTTIVASIYGLMGRHTSPTISGSTVRQHVDRIFEACRSSVADPEILKTRRRATSICWESGCQGTSPLCPRKLKNGNEKALRETQTLRAGCSKAEPKLFAPPQTPFPGHSMAKI